MYQHDVPDSRLKTALDEVVQACVSFVGVDLNTASRFLLRRVSGLSDARAKSILAYRTENGPFVCRQQLMKVSLNVIYVFLFTRDSMQNINKNLLHIVAKKTSS
jgi:transcriptional accessory protein Tex/SPT6